MKINIPIKDHCVNENSEWRKPEVGEVFAKWGSVPIHLYVRVDDWNKDSLFGYLNTKVGIAVLDLHISQFGWMYPGRCADGSQEDWGSFEIINSELSVYNEH